MQLTSLYLLVAWTALALASLNVGQSEFHMGVILPRQQSRTNLQVFSGALGGTGASAITNSGDPERPFEVDGDTFVCPPPPPPNLPTYPPKPYKNAPPPQDLQVRSPGTILWQKRDYDTAANRACDNQKNACADIANNKGGNFEVGDCDQQTGESALSPWPACPAQLTHLPYLSAYTSLPCPTSLPAPLDTNAGVDWGASWVRGAALADGYLTEQCKSSASSATVKSFAAAAPVLVSSDDQFDYFC